MHVKRYIPMMVLLLLSVFVLAACGHSVTLKEKRVEGVQSNIIIALPGNAHELPLPVTLDPITQRYVKGQKFYGEINQGLNIAIFTTTVSTGQMYQDLGITRGQAINDTLARTLESASGAILNKIDAEHVQASQESMTVSGVRGVVQTLSFDIGEKRMKAKLLGFTKEDATWIILVAADVESDSSSAIDDIITSVRVE